jgi:hypothetical protein
LLPDFVNGAVAPRAVATLRCRYEESEGSFKPACPQRKQDGADPDSAEYQSDGHGVKFGRRPVLSPERPGK